MKSCWIFCGAPTYKFNIMPPTNVFVIAADSGYTLLKEKNIKPNILLGDFDSFIGTKPHDCEIIVAPTEKDDTDTMLAVKTALSRGYDDITIAASIGGRLDHTFANMQTLAYISANGGRGCLIGENDTVYFCTKGEYNFPKIDNMYFSVFSYTEEANISLNGTKYTLNNYCLTNKFPLGVSNEIIDEEGHLIVNDGQIIVIFSKM